jgi:TPR repeat protein
VYLGNAYYIGQGVPQDNVQAVAWYRKVGDKGNARAQFNLGFMYANGEGVPQDNVEALKWFNLAAFRARNAVQQEYADTRDALAALMPPAQISQALKRASAWIEAFE